MRIVLPALLVLASSLATVTPLFSHCQIPCGIYDDEVRFTLMEEDVTTIEKSMNEITTAAAASNWNQTVRWVENKEEHADKLSEIITFYFMAQRVKPVPAGDEGYTDYLEQVALLHRMLVQAMKAKQTTDLQHVEALRALIGEFHESYLGAGH